MDFFVWKEWALFLSRGKLVVDCEGFPTFHKCPGRWQKKLQVSPSKQKRDGNLPANSIIIASWNHTTPPTPSPQIKLGYVWKLLHKIHPSRPLGEFWGFLTVFYPWVRVFITLRITEAFGLPKPSLFSWDIYKEMLLLCCLDLSWILNSTFV